MWLPFKGRDALMRARDLPGGAGAAADTAMRDYRASLDRGLQ
jgi:hypothetical protein